MLYGLRSPITQIYAIRQYILQISKLELLRKVICYVPTLRFKEYSDTWQETPFDSTFDILTNNTLSRAELNHEDGTYKNIHYGDVLIKFPAHIDVEDQEVPFVNEDSSSVKFDDALLQDGDIVIADTAEDYTVGKATEIENSSMRKVVSGLHTIPCRPKMKFAARYLGFYINSPAYHNQLIPYIQGVKVSSVSKTLIKNTSISYPSYGEQSKIAEFLSALDSKIETQNKIIEDLKILKKELCNRHFKSIHNDSTLEYIPLKSILSERKEYCSKDGTYTHGTLSKEGVEPKTERYDRDFLVKNEDKQYKVTHFNDICYNPANLKFGVICRNTYGDLIFSPIYVTFEISNSVYPAYMELFLTNANFIGRIRRYEQGTVYERMSVSPEDFLSYEIRMPAYEEQVKFADKIQRIHEKIELESAILDKYQSQRKYLLNAMFI